MKYVIRKIKEDNTRFICPECMRTVLTVKTGDLVALPEECGYCGKELYFREEDTDIDTEE